jgi:hypothetical protein
MRVGRIEAESLILIAGRRYRRKQQFYSAKFSTDCRSFSTDMSAMLAARLTNALLAVELGLSNPVRAILR